MASNYWTSRHRGGWTAMVSAYAAGRSEVVKILKEAGARNERVTTATGEPLAEESAPMHTVRAYLAAIQAGDLHAIQQLRTGKTLISKISTHYASTTR